MSTRIDIFNSLHKGIYYALNQVMTALERANFENHENSHTVAQEFMNLWMVLHFHNRTEDELIFPYLARGNEELLQDLEKRCNHLEQEMQSMEELFVDLENFSRVNDDSVKTDMLETGTELYEQFKVFYFEYFFYLQQQEHEANPVLWQMLSDEEIMEISLQGQANNTPLEMRYYLPYYIKAIDNEERYSFLEGLKKKTPAEKFSTVLRVVQESVDTQDWNALATKIASEV